MLLPNPFLYRSDWLLHNESSWLRIQFSEGSLPCFVKMSRWPVLPLVVLQCGLRPNLQYVRTSTLFSIGWTTAHSACQLARVVSGQLRQGDENVHVCIFHFPNVVADWSLRDPDYVRLAHFHGYVDGGFNQTRYVSMISPFHHLHDFRLALAMDVANNRFCIRVNDHPTISTPAFFSESHAPGSMRFCLPAWHSFAYSHDSHPPRVDLQLVDVSAHDVLMPISLKSNTASYDLDTILRSPNWCNALLCDCI